MHTLVLVSTFHIRELIFFSEPARNKVTFGRDMESMNLIYYLTLKLFFQYVIGYIPETQ